MNGDAHGDEGGPIRTRAYAQAMRHSRRVRLYKRAIPVGAAVAVVLLVVLTLFNPFRGASVGLTLGPLSLSGTKIVMEQPRLTGFQKDTRPYEVTATEAAQDVKRPNFVELTALRARLVMDESGTVARLEAERGTFDTQKEQLELRQDVRVTTTSGYSADLKSAFIDFKAGTVLSREPVRVGINGGSVEAEGVDIADSGRVLVFQGRVRSVFRAPAEAPSKSGARAAPSPPEAATTSAEAVPSRAGLRTSDAAPVDSRP